MKLSLLTQGQPFIPPEWDREFQQIHADSRDVAAGDLFIARQGSAQDGRRHIDDAIARGAVAVLAEGELAFECASGGVPVFSTPELTLQLPLWLQRRYPQNQLLPLVGVTGTNGKSSVTQYIAQLASHVGKKTGVLGTLGNGIWPDLQPTRNTTPDLSIVRRTLQQLDEQQAQLVALEVSSHGLEQGRVAGLQFHTAVMTNLTQDHLDYHGDMENYFNAKARLFRDFPLQYALINCDDDYGRRLLQDGAVSATRYSYGQSQQADIRYSINGYHHGLLTADITSPWGRGSLALPLIGDFNLANAVAAIAVLCLQGYEFPHLLEAARSLKPVAGRMELYCRDVIGHQGTRTQLAVIDFAHTPDALANVMAAVKQVAPRQALVFGCGGDRDRSKRRLMADVAVRSGVDVWLTDDNPRFEDPQQIFADVLSAAGSDAFHTEHERSAAIASAVASDAELIVIAGKGHENYQDVGGVKHPYCDEQVLLDLGFAKAGDQYD